MRNELFRLVVLVALFSGFGAFMVGYEVSKWANSNQYVMDYVSILIAAFSFGFGWDYARQIKTLVDRYAEEK
jgi:hypothetical protein